MTQASDRLTAFTPEERCDLVEIYGANPERVMVIPGGVDTDLFHPVDQAQARRELGLGDGKILLFAGRIEPIKGIDILIRAMALIKGNKGLRLLIVGGDLDGNTEVSRLRSLAGTLGINDRVRFWGAAEQDRMPLFYNAADICVIPSLHESFCLVALEAMACGTPVVASRVGGLMTTIRDGKTGFLVRELVPEAFAERLELILGNEGLAQRLGNAGHITADEYKWSAIAGKLLSVYEQTINTLCKVTCCRKNISSGY